MFFESGHINLVINGEQVTSTSKYTVTDPSTQEHLWTYSSASSSDTAKAVEAANGALASWSALNVRKRSKVLLRAADLMLECQNELSQTMRSETAADAAFVAFNIHGTVKQLRDLAGRAITIQNQSPSVEDNNRSALVLWEPYGVVAGIAPWNAPYILGTRSFAAALVMGNTVVLKGSELAPGCFKLIVDIFHEAGLPKGCLNLLFSAREHAADVTRALIEHSWIAKISFTGSSAVGKIVARQAGHHLRPVLLELGGKASALVFEDANLELAAKECLIDDLLHSGQVCMATERILVEASIAVKFKKVLQKTLTTLKQESSTAWVGRPTMISAAAAQGVHSLISDALEKGANVLDEQVDDNCARGSRSGLAPTILHNVKDDMEIFYNESFGPVLTIHTFESEEDALELANNTEYGLVGSIFTTDLRKGLRVAKAYRTEAVHINSMSIHDEANLPHGGTKASGFGRFNAEQGLLEWVQTKVGTWDN